MGLSYEFQIVAPRGSFDALIQATADRAPPHLRDPLLAAALRVAAGETLGEPLCLSLLFPSDGPLRRYGGNPRYDRPEEDLVSIGCIYVCAWLGLRDLIVTYAAATSGMSRLFDESPSVRETFRSIGVAADATSVALDRERGDLVHVWPRAVTTPGFASYFSSMDERERVDAYAAALRDALAEE